MKKNIIKKNIIKKGLSLLMLSALIAGTLTGCSIFRSTVQDDDSKKSTNDSKKLASGQYYVWHDESQSNIENDINVDVSKFKRYNYDIFRPVYIEGALKNKAAGDNYKTIMISAENEDNIPTLYKGDELIFVSDDNIPKSFSFERYYDHGYSVGISGLTEYITGSGNYVLNMSNNENINIKSNSSAAKLANYLSDDVIISFPYIGDKKITASDISKSGTIKGLLLNSEYNTSIYIGSKRYTLKLRADTRIFSSYEQEFTSNQYSFVGSNVMKITIPEYFKSGYYCINGMGLFRYVADGDSYDNSTNFNDSIIVRDDAGRVIYNPVPSYVEGSKTDNFDAINQSGAVTSIKKSVTINSAQKVKVDIGFSDLSDKTAKGNIQVKYYLKSDNTTSTSNTNAEKNAATTETKAAAAKNNTVSKSVKDATQSATSSSAKQNSENTSNSTASITSNTNSNINTMDESTLGTEDNPYVIIATAEELTNGTLTRELQGLKSGNWIFEFFGTSNYKTHSEKITLISTNGDTVTK